MILNVGLMRELDSKASSKGVDTRLLMEEAGFSIYMVASREVGVRGVKYCVVAGPGSNGGDAIVASRILASRGAVVKALVVARRERVSSITREKIELAEKTGVEVGYVESEDEVGVLRECLEWCDCIIDGLFGTGLSREVAGVYKRVIEAVNSSGKRVISVDIPSGVGGDDGLVYGVAVKADYTVTMAFPKLGNILYPGYHYCGKLFIARLSYPRELVGELDSKIYINTPIEIPERLRWGHKGSFGKLLVVGGARNYYGAPYFSARSFLKAGGGYSRLAAPKSIIPFIAARASELVYIPLEENDAGAIAESNVEFILDLINRYRIDIVVLGPGASLDPEAQRVIRRLVASIDKPIVIDGDGITAVAGDTSVLVGRSAPTIITPHLAEMSRLTGLSMNDIMRDRIGVLREYCRKFKAYIVLKGAHSLIGTPEGRVYVNLTGNPGMATPGSGDVLNGVIAAMYGLGLDVEGAVRMGVLAHGLAGDLAAEEIGEDGVTAEDIMSKLPEAIRILRSDREFFSRRYMPIEL